MRGRFVLAVKCESALTERWVRPKRWKGECKPPWEQGWFWIEGWARVRWWILAGESRGWWDLFKYIWTFRQGVSICEDEKSLAPDYFWVGNSTYGDNRVNPVPPDWWDSGGWALPHKPKGHRFNSQSEHIPCLQVRSPLGIWGSFFSLLHPSIPSKNK